MFKLTVSNVNADPRGDTLNGIFDSIPEVIEHLLNNYRGMTRLSIEIQGPTKWDIMICPMIKTYHFVMEEVSFAALADAKKIELGLEVYDTALPITWCDSVKQMTGEWPYAFVWGYKKSSTFGEPIPLTPSAEKLLARYAQEMNEKR